MKAGRFVAIGCIGMQLLSCKPDPESPANKHEWSIVESLDARFHKGIDDLKIVQEDGQSAVGIPYDGKVFWILLDPKASPYYKQIPAGNYVISADALRRIKASTNVHPEVIKNLAAHVGL
jgi:hypothetical protein